MDAKPLFFILCASLAGVGEAAALPVTAQNLVGRWATPGAKAVVELETGGTGARFVYSGSLCGQITDMMPLRWALQGDVLTQSYSALDGGKVTAQMRIVTLEEDAMTGVAQSGISTRYVRAPACTGP